jgi:hypothetical protein
MKTAMARFFAAIGGGLFLTLIVAGFCFAQGQTRIRDYETARRQHFWHQLYNSGGEDLYCGARFTSRQGLSIEHVYTADWIADKFGCPN